MQRALSVGHTFFVLSSELLNLKRTGVTLQRRVCALDGKVLLFAYHEFWAGRALPFDVLHVLIACPTTKTIFSPPTVPSCHLTLHCGVGRWITVRTSYAWSMARRISCGRIGFAMPLAAQNKHDVADEGSHPQSTNSNEGDRRELALVQRKLLYACHAKWLHGWRVG